MLTLPDLALQVGEEEAGVGQGGVGGAVVGVVLAPRLLPTSHPASYLLINVGQEIQHIFCPDVVFNNRAAAESTWPRGVLADAVDAGQGGVAGGEEDAGVDQLELARTKVCDVAATRVLTTKLTALPKSQDRRLNGDHTLVKSTSLLLSLTFSIREP